MKPIINMDELEFEPDGPNLPGKSASVASRIGARKLGYNVSLCPPGKSVCPFHNHYVDEEMFFLLAGEGTLRFGSEEYPLRKGDFIACPPGGREVAHQIINTGPSDLIYLALSTLAREEICEYPDSKKVGIYVGKQGERILRKLFVMDSDVPYDHAENSDHLRKD